MEAVNFVSAKLGEILGCLPAGAHGAIEERTGSEIPQLDDYPIDWQLTVAPKNPMSCPIELIASCAKGAECSWGFFFDTRGRIATNLGLKVGRRSRNILGFGTEPIRMEPERVVAIIEAVVQGHVTLQYRTLAGRLTQTAGVVSIPGDQQQFRGYGLPLGARRVFQYPPWDGSRLTLMRPPRVNRQRYFRTAFLGGRLVQRRKELGFCVLTLFPCSGARRLPCTKHLLRFTVTPSSGPTELARSET